VLPRAELVTAALAPVVAGRSAGVVFVGETGSGKTTLALAAAPPGDFVRLRGSTLTSAVPYGLLFGLLKSAETDAFANSSAFFSVLNDAIAAETSSPRPTIVVDNAHLADELSSHALAQLATSRAVTLVLAAPEVGDLPEAFLDLWRDGLLAVTEVPPFSATEVAAVLSEYLNAPVVPAASRHLAERSGGNPLFLNYLVIEQLEAGLLAPHEGSWTLAGRAAITSDRLIGMLKTRFDQWSDAQQEVLEIVALLESVPLDRLEQVVDAERIAELLDAGAIEVQSADRTAMGIPSIAMANSLVAEVVRAGVPFLRRRQLRERMAPFFTDPSGSDYQGVLAFSVWTLECGARLEPELALHAARLANRLFDPEFAIRVSSTVTEGPFQVPAAIQKSRAMRMLGRAGNAGQIIRRLAPAASTDDSLEVLAEFVQEAARVQGAHPGFSEFESLHTVAADRIDGVPPTAATEALSRRLELARWSLALGSGDHRGALDDVQAAFDRLEERDGTLALAPADRAGEAPADLEYRIRLTGMLAECLCAVGRQNEALALALPLESAEREAGLSEDAIDELHATLSLVYLSTGQWRRRRELIDSRSRGVLGRELYRGGGDDGALGVGHLFGGASRLGRRHLMSALSQLRLRDAGNARGEILAALAYSSALDGDLEGARDFLAESRAGVVAAWGSAASATYLALSTEALLDGDGDAAERMLATADLYRARGLAADAFLLTSAAARSGSDAAIERLASDRMPQPGPLAAAVYLWVDGLRAGDPSLVLDAAEAMLAQDNDLFAREIAERVVETAPPALVGRAAAIVRQADEVLGERLRSTAAVSRFDGLTNRERDVARLVADGATNRDVAAALHLSVRTVESYLQSAFNKLGVANRRELAELSAAAG
jgi:DNA-binding CsgD family transcriptional regulator